MLTPLDELKLAEMRRGLAVIGNSLMLDRFDAAEVWTVSAVNDRGCGTLDTHVVWLLHEPFVAGWIPRNITTPVFSISLRLHPFDRGLI